MPKTRFAMDLEIDENGVMIARFQGIFDAEEWIRQRDAARARDYPDVDLNGRPIVCDLRECDLPEADWESEFAKVYSAIRERHHGPFRRAIITDDDVGKQLGVKLFIELEKIAGRPGIETRGFDAFDDGYAWAAEGWLEG